MRITSKKIIIFTLLILLLIIGLSTCKKNNLFNDELSIKKYKYLVKMHKKNEGDDYNKIKDPFLKKHILLFLACSFQDENNKINYDPPGVKRLTPVKHDNTLIFKINSSIIELSTIKINIFKNKNLIVHKEILPQAAVFSISHVNGKRIYGFDHHYSFKKNLKYYSLTKYKSILLKTKKARYKVPSEILENYYFVDIEPKNYIAFKKENMIYLICQNGDARLVYGIIFVFKNNSYFEKFVYNPHYTHYKHQ